MNDLQDKKNKIPVKPSDLSEAGAAERFSEICEDEIKWTKSLGWMVWDGQRWMQSDALAMAASMAFSQMLLDDAKRFMVQSRKDEENETGEPSKEARDYMRYANKMRNSRPIANILTLAESQLVTDAAKFDSNPYDLNTPAGIVDLRTGEIRDPAPDAYCSKLTACEPSTEGAALFDEFLDTITGSNSDLKEYLQISAGSCAIGQIFHEGIQIAIGGGRNGKSTYYNLLTAVLGDYAGHINVNVITTDRTNKGAALATLRGKRLVTCGELEEGQRLSTQMLKQLASTDTLTIEEKYRQPEAIKPTHHIVMFSNHLPRVGSTDDGTWRRIQLVPFNETIQPGTDKPNYADTLFRKAGGAVLSWIIEGARKFIQAGCHLNVPEAVKEATNKYRGQEDWLQNFIDDRCKVEDEKTKGLFIGVGALYQAYKEYADQSGVYRRSMPDFNRAMESAGFPKVGIQGGRKVWRCIDLMDAKYLEEQLSIEGEKQTQ